MARDLSVPTIEDWWELAEDLADYAVATACIELPAATRDRLVEMMAELAALITSWPTTPQPISPLRYLRVHRDRTERHIPWLYELPPPTRKILTGTDRLPSLFEFALVDSETSPSLRRTWGNGLIALTEVTEGTDRRQ